MAILDVERLSAQRAHSLRHVHRMNDCNAPITFEVVQIEGEDLIHLLRHHCSNYPGVMDLNPAYLIVKHKRSPSWENLRRLRKEIEERLKAIHVSSCLLGSETETIPGCRPRRGIPEFAEVLRKAEKLLTLTLERLHRTARGCAQLRVESLDSINRDHRYQFSRRIAPSPIPGGT
jgi:hypothetical protein